MSMSMAGDLNVADVSMLPGTCDQCEAENVTRVAQVIVPSFKEMILMTSSCDSCGSRSTDVFSAADIADTGLRYELSVRDKSDLNRTIVRTDSTKIKIKEMSFVSAAGRNQSTITTVEGILATFKDAIETILRDEIETAGGENEAKIKGLRKTVEDLEKAKNAEFPFTFVADDPLGNCFVQPYDGDGDGRLSKTEYPRTEKQNIEYGITE